MTSGAMWDNCKANASFKEISNIPQATPNQYALESDAVELVFVGPIKLRALQTLCLGGLRSFLLLSTRKPGFQTSNCKDFDHNIGATNYQETSLKIK